MMGGRGYHSVAVTCALVAAVSLGSPSTTDGMEPWRCNPIVERLSTLEGRWTVEWTRRTSPGEYADLQGEAGVRFDLDECAAVEHFSSRLSDGTPFQAITLITMPEEGRFHRARTDSEHGGIGLSHGVERGDTIVFEREIPLENRTLRTRHLYFDLASSSFQVEFYLSPSSDSDWELVERFEYLRREEAGQGERTVL